MTYEALRQFADSWGLLFMTVLFLSLVAWTFRPRARGRYEDAAQMIFNDASDSSDSLGASNAGTPRDAHINGRASGSRDNG